MERRKSVAHKPGTYASGFLARLGLAGFLALSLAGCLGYEGDVVHGYQIDPKLLDQVKVGSSAEQALIVMGTPSTTSTVGGDAWYYITQKTDRPVLFMDARITDQRVLAIYFDKDKRVERIANYGLQDGKLFDFVSRTTPTGGAEFELPDRPIQEHAEVRLEAGAILILEKLAGMLRPFAFPLSAPGSRAAEAPRYW